MDIKEQILVALGLNKAEKELKLAWQAKSDDGTIFVSTAEELESGVDISVLTEDGTTIPLPIGTYKVDTGVSFRVEEEGVVAEVIESETEEEVTDEEMSEEVALAPEDDKEDYDEEDDRKETADVGDWRGMEKRIQNLEDAVADLKRQIGETGDVEEMAEETPEEVSDKPKTIKKTETVEFSAEDFESLEEELENLTEENRKLKIELAESPAEAPINTNKFSSGKTVLSKKQYNKLSKQERFLYNLNK
jgi:predicted RNase H-like nuclease (RuvC/YqgF family)